MKKFLKNNWILLLIIALAIFFRYWQIGSLPGGLFPDEAANGLDINSMHQGQIQPFYERGNGREAGFFYFEALSSAIFGKGPWQFHIVSAAFGVAEVLACYFVAKRLFNKNTALLATFFFAVSSYAVTMERTAFRANTVPLLTSLTVLFVLKYFQSTDHKNKRNSAILAGLFFGLGFYTYPSFKMMIPLLGGFAGLLLFAHRDKLKETIKTHRKAAIAFLIAFLIAFSWIGSYFVKDPGGFVGRAGQVSVFNPTLNKGDLTGTIVDVAKKTMLSFFTQGDKNWRQNVSGFPFLTPLISPFFALALIIFTIALFRLLKQVFDQKVEQGTVIQALLACWFWFMLAPEMITAEGIPHGLRIAGVIPVIYIMSAWGIYWLWEKMPALPAGRPHNEHIKAHKYLIAGFFIATVLVYNFVLYFGIAANSADYYYAFRSDLTDVANYLNDRNLKDKTYLSLDTFSVQTIDYLTTDLNRPYQLVDPAHTFELKLKKGDQVVFSMSTLFDSKKFCESHPTAKLVTNDKNRFGLTAMAVYEFRGVRGDTCEPTSNPNFNTNPT